MAKDDDMSKTGGVPDAADSNGLDEAMAANPDYVEAHIGELLYSLLHVGDH